VEFTPYCKRIQKNRPQSPADGFKPINLTAAGSINPHRLIVMRNQAQKLAAG